MKRHGRFYFVIMISSPFSAVINHLLAQEPWARDKLARHVGKVAVFDGGIAALRLKVAADGMLQGAGADDTPNVTIRARLADLPLIAQNRERAFSYVQIDGDADFAPDAVGQTVGPIRARSRRSVAAKLMDRAAEKRRGGFAMSKE